MLFRKFSTYLEHWKIAEKKPALLVEGARQIGKTTLIRDFAQKHYEHFAEINFITSPSAKTIFDGNLDAETLISKLTAFLRKPLPPRRTLIFFDEVQECPRIRTAIKFLVEDGRFDYIESGSLLGINYQNVPSYAVGFEEIQTMYPMDFEEFAIANGVQPETFALLKKSYESRTEVDQTIHEMMQNLFTEYLIVGGMPAAVQTYVTTRDIHEVVRIQTAILKLYRLDIQKYSRNNKAKITTIFNQMPAELNSKNKRFMLSDLTKTARMNRYESCFNWLTDAGVALPCYNLRDLKHPLEINRQRNLFKYFLCDTGLLCALCSNDIQFQIISGNYRVNEGSILENIFAQQLVANGFPLYYYGKKLVGEIDFIVERQAEIILVEIKSGEDYDKHKALDNVLDQKDTEVSQAIVFCKGNIHRKGAITYLPHYLVMFFQNEHLLDAATEKLRALTNRKEH
ncbi:MAG TPA: AAA family ATPase [Methanocorpusculum sp.]|nr:AAA family ATPase [Methanocorpusculum sp.]